MEVVWVRADRIWLHHHLHLSTLAVDENNQKARNMRKSYEYY